MSRHLAAVPDKPGRVALYVRVSALMGRGGDDFHSPELQVTAMRRVIPGMREVAVIEDIDQTGRTFTRDGIDQIRRLAEAGSIDALAVYNVSRLGRNVLESLQFLSWLADRGVTILSASENLDTSTPTGRWMLTTMLGLAEMQSDQIGDGWSQTIHHRARAGKHHGRPPTGYVRGEGGRLAEDPIVGAAIRRMFADYAAGEQVRTVRRRLQAATGLVLAASTVKRMLTNRTYRGVVHVGARGPAGAVDLPDAHVPLVDEPTWQLVQTRLATDRRTPSKLLAPKYALSGIGRCGVCNGRTNHRPESRNGTVRIFCAAQWELTAPCAGCGSCNVADVEAAVLAKVERHIARLRGDVGAHAAQASKASRAGIDATAVRAELDATRRAMAKATERWAREQIDDRTYRDAMGSLRAAEDRLSATLGGLDRSAAVPEPGQIVALAAKLLELWSRMDGGQRNRSLRDLVETVTIMPAARYRQPVDERVSVQWR